MRGMLRRRVSPSLNRSHLIEIVGNGGEGGIRTLGTGISQYNGLANESFSPPSLVFKYSQSDAWPRVGLRVPHSAVIVLRIVLRRLAPTFPTPAFQHTSSKEVLATRSPTSRVQNTVAEGSAHCTYLLHAKEASAGMFCLEANTRLGETGRTEPLGSALPKPIPRLRRIVTNRRLNFTGAES